MSAMASQTTVVSIVYSTSSADQGKHQSSPSLAFVRGIHRWPVNSPHKWPVTRKMFPFNDVIMHKKSHRPSSAPTRGDDVKLTGNSRLIGLFLRVNHAEKTVLFNLCSIKRAFIYTESTNNAERKHMARHHNDDSASLASEIAHKHVYEALVSGCASWIFMRHYDTKS